MIDINIDNKICYIRINRPKHLNAINVDLLNKLRDTLDKYKNSKEFGSVILTGNGDKAFIAGADIKAMSLMTSDEAHQFSKLGNEITLIMDNYPKPIIGAINGYALGGGCEIAMACHIRFASNNALFGQPESGLGLIPGFGGTQRLPRIVGLSNAYKILLSGFFPGSNGSNNLTKANLYILSCFILESDFRFANTPLPAGIISIVF